MAECIEREEMLREIERRESLMVGDKTISVDALKRFILNRPAADVAPVVYGRWASVPGKRERICSRCQCDEPYKFADENAKVFEYCPHCGAKMDGGGSDEAD